MPLPDAIHYAVALPGGEVLVIGGSSGGPDPYLAMRAVDRYDPATGTWTSLSPTIYPYLSGVGGVLLPDGRVLVVGGQYGSESYVLQRARAAPAERAAPAFPAARAPRAARAAPRYPARAEAVARPQRARHPEDRAPLPCWSWGSFRGGARARNRELVEAAPSPPGSFHRPTPFSGTARPPRVVGEVPSTWS
ncbi:hypothetical protein WMF38_49535 [Sorangium sp. So ce118]